MENSLIFKEIARSTKVNDIIEVFKEMLIKGELKPGVKLPSEVQLMKQLNVGRTALREAIKMLSALGVIEVKQGDGSYIVEGASAAAMSPLVFAILLESGMNRDLLELRTLLEVGYCQLASKKAYEEDLELILLAAMNFEEKVASKSRDIDEITAADLGFHYSILNGTHNPLIIAISRAVEDLFFGSIKKTISKEEGRLWGVDGHKRIIEAIRSGNPSQIRESVILSLERWSEELN